MASSKVRNPYPCIAEHLQDYEAPPDVVCFKDMQKTGQMYEKKISKLLNTYAYANYRFKEMDIRIVNNVTSQCTFSIKKLEYPAVWGDLAVKIFASKYLIKDKETSIIDAIIRVVTWVVFNGVRGGYLGSIDLALSDNEVLDTWDEYAIKLFDVIINQRGIFNSPVWFNVGAGKLTDFCTTSGCFVTKVEDHMGSLMANSIINQMIALGGSGSGADLTPIRSKLEDIGGDEHTRPTGPVGFMKMFDAVLQATRSGGKHRRSAGLVSLKTHHRDIKEFIRFKAIEERKGHWLASMPGFDLRFASEDQMSIFGSLAVQNINPAVRIMPEFWKAYYSENGNYTYDLLDRHGNAVGKQDARKLLELIAKCQLECGDPGLQYHDNINAWNPFYDSGQEFHSSNACGEMQWLNNSACNLASLRITAYFEEDGSELPINFKLFEDDIRTMLIAQDILINYSYYPTVAIAKTSHETRNLGLNFGDIGHLLFKMGLPYNSSKGRAVAAYLSAYMTGHAYTISREIAVIVGSCEALKNDVVTDSMQVLLERHLGYVTGSTDEAIATGPNNRKINMTKTNMLYEDGCFMFVDNYYTKLCDIWNTVIQDYKTNGLLRNTAVTVFVPMGTVGLALGCHTTGIEPILSHVVKKKMVGGGSTIFETDLHISKEAMDRFNRFVTNHGHTCFGDCSKCNKMASCDLVKTSLGINPLTPEEHILMMAAVQPFISLAQSKCVTGNTVITTTDGLKRIGSLYNGEEPDSFSDIDLDVPTGMKTAKADAFYYGGERKIWEVILEDGRSIKGTNNHKLLIATDSGFGWRKLPNIKEDDFVVVHYGANCWGDGNIPETDINQYNDNGQQQAITIPDKSSFELGLFFGMLTADGHISRTNYVIGLTKNNEAVLKKFQYLLKHLFNLDSKKITDERNGVTEIIKSSKSLMEWLDGVGFSKKHIPDFILGGTREMMLGYLSGIYLDGWVVTKGLTRTKQTNNIGISQRYLGIIRDLQCVWSNFGIRTYINKNIVNGKNYPTLQIKSIDLVKAGELITWLEIHKKDRFELLKDRKYTDTARWPFINEVRRVARNCFDSRSKYARFRYIKKAPYRATIMKMFADCEYESSKKRVTYDYLRVVDVISHRKRQDVYDIAVPGAQRFIGNGILNHNTINCPSNITVPEIVKLYELGYELGLKAITIYVDNSKVLQPLTDSVPVSTQKETTKIIPTLPIYQTPVDSPTGPRNLLDPCERIMRGWAVTVGGQKLYVSFGWHPDNMDDIWELWLRMSGIGGTLDGTTSTIAIMASQNLQKAMRLGKLAYDVEKARLIKTFLKMTYPPNGLVTWGGGRVPEVFKTIRSAKSIQNLVGQMLASISKHSEHNPLEVPVALAIIPEGVDCVTPLEDIVLDTDRQCTQCGRTMVKSGMSSSCYTCLNCGDSVGGCG